MLPSDEPWLPFVLLVSDVVGGLLWIGYSALLPLLFPDGQIPSRRWRPVLWAIASVAVVAAVGVVLTDGPLEQIKWFLLGFTVAVGGITLTAVPALQAAGDVVTSVAFAALPITMGIAITRYRLYEIDRLLSRTVAYVVAVAFQPLRGRVQVLVERRFNRRRYDANGTLEAFGRSLRDELDREAIAAVLGQVARQSLQPRSLTVVLTPRPG